MSGFLGGARRALFEDGSGHRSIVEAIGRAVVASGNPGSLTSIRQVYSPEEQATYRWEITLPNRHEALRFDEAVRAACAFMIPEEE